MSNRIKELRMRDNMSQDDLAKLLNVQRAAVSKYENEKIPLAAQTIDLLTKIFDVSSDYLLGISNVNIKDDNYYHNEDTAELAQEIFEDPKLKILMSASRNLKRDDLEALIRIVESMKPRED